MFTRDQIEEIKKKLIMLGTKDTQFPDAHKLNGEEIIAIVQDGENKKIPLSSIINDDFINVSKDTTGILTLSTAVSKIDINNRKLGQVITFKDSANSWTIRQFTGSSLDNWNDISLWKSISGIDELKSQVETNTSNISSINTEVSTLQSKVDENTTSISQINNNIADNNKSIAQINTTLEEHTESINAKITTDRIENGAVISEKIATSAFDSTLSVSGKIAPADAVGEKLTELEQVVESKLDKRMSEDWQNYETEVKTGALLSSVYNTQYSNSAFCNTSFLVQEGERYRIKGWSVNTDYCGLWLKTSNSITRLVTTTGAFEEEITIPSGILSVGVNAKMSGTGSLSVEKWMNNEQTSEEFYKRIDAIADSVDSMFRPHKYGIEINENSVAVFIKGYDDMHDAFYKFVPKSGNGLWDFYGLGKVVNTDKDVRVSSPGSADITWLSVGDTDYISPSVVYAKTNADGDFPDTSTQKLTGGWHMYNNATSGNYRPTARNISFKVFCDGVKVKNSGVRGNDVRIEIINRLQGSNTEKSDGTGREIVEQKFIITFDGFKAIVKGETIALEDVYYHTYYGLSAYYSVSQNNIFFLGSRADRGGHSPLGSVGRSADKYGYGIRQLSGTDVFDTVINTSVDVGSFYANRASWSIQISSRKAYPFIIYAASADFANMLALNAGEQFTWEGYYDMHP